MAKSKSINLLPQEEFEASILGRILRWAMGSFRIIVIITEMVVMAAFLSRFYFDAQNSDLNDSIKVDTAEISAQKDFEGNFRRIQGKLDIFNNLSTSGLPTDKLDLITAKLPSDIVLSSINIGPVSSEMKGVSASELGIAQLMSNLKAEQSFKTVELENISSSQTNSSQTDFLIKVTF